MSAPASMRNRRRLGALVAAAVVALVLTACGDAGYSLTEKDAYGTWRAGSNLPTTLTLNEDGTFHASEWPLNVDCGGFPPKAVKELRGTKTVDFAGRWHEGQGMSINELRLMPSSPSPCDTPWIAADFRSEDGVVYACVGLDVPVDEARAENWFILYLGEPEATPDPGRCFNYN